LSNLIFQNTFGCLNLTDIILILNNPYFTFLLQERKSFSKCPSHSFPWLWFFIRIL